MELFTGLTEELTNVFARGVTLRKMRVEVGLEVEQSDLKSLEWALRRIRTPVDC